LYCIVYNMGIIEITPTIGIDENEIQENFLRSSGPGGQNVNKVSTMVQLRFDIAGSRSLPDEVKNRLISLAGNRVNEDGSLIIESQRFRSQKKNREDAFVRLKALICRAAEKPKTRYLTKPTIASQEQRLESKRQRSQTKKERGPLSIERE